MTVNTSLRSRFLTWTQCAALCATVVVLIGGFASLRVTFHPHSIFIHPLGESSYALYPLLIPLGALNTILVIARIRESRLVH